MRSTAIRTSLLGVGVSAFVLALAGCGGSSGGSSGDTYEIGAILTLSGPSADLGKHEERTAKLAVDQINAKGGVNGHKLKLVVKDDSGNPNNSVNAFNSLNNDKGVLGIFGATLGSGTLAFSPLENRAQVPVIAPDSTYEVTHPLNKWVFRAGVATDTEAIATAKLLKSQNITRVGILHTTDANGAQAAKNLEKMPGVTIVGNESMSPDATDVTTQLTKLRGKKPQALLIWALSPSTGIALKNAGQLGIDLPIISGGSSNNVGNIAAAAGSPALKHWTVFHFGYSVGGQVTPAQRTAATLIEKHTGALPDIFATLGWDGVQLFAQGLKSAGKDADRSSLRDALEQLQGYQGLAGSYSYSADNHEGLGPDAAVWQRVSGKRFVTANTN